MPIKAAAMSDEGGASEKSIRALCADAFGKDLLNNHNARCRLNILPYKHEVRISDPDDFYRLVKSLHVKRLTRSGYHLLFNVRVGVTKNSYGDAWTVINTNEADTFIRKYGPLFLITHLRQSRR